MIPLTRDEEVALVRRARSGDKSAEDVLITRNLPLVGDKLRAFTCQGLDPDDLFQIGSMGLIRAARRFNPDNGCRFSTYATCSILNALKRAVRKASRTRLDLVDFDRIGHPAAASQLDDGEPMNRRVAEAVEQLAPDERQVLALNFSDLRERSCREIGAALGRSKFAVGRVRRRALAKIRARLQSSAA